jgi:3-dehydroquinate dehydratase/shikimate dehydrogenase
MGHFGVNTRILAEHLGSYLSYTAVQNEPDMPSAAPGQLDPKELAELYRFREITYKTRLFGILGYPLRVTSSPIFFNRVFGEENIDAVYIPFPSDSLESFLELAELLHLEGVSVTVPYKQAVMEHLEAQSDEVKHVGACNTLVHSPRGWMGYNTDARGFSDSLMEFIKKKTLKGKRLTIIGAGGAARAVAAEIYRLKGSALILNRTSLRARELAAPYKFAWGGTDTRGIEQMNQFQDIIIQTTSVGMEPDIEEDPLEEYIFSGKEAVMDLIYKPEQTRFLQRAVKAGCTVINGYDMLLRQARYQYNLYMGKEFPSQLLSRIQLSRGG